MKSKNNIRKPETLEEIVFEGRNKTYGAFELNRKSRKYMTIALLVSFIGVSSAVAVPFIKSFHRTPTDIPINRDNKYVLADFIPKPIEPPKLPIDIPEKDLMANLLPKVVVKADTTLEMIPMEELLGMEGINKPVDIEVQPVNAVPAPVPADDPEDRPMTSPQEPATFQGGDVLSFRDWVVKNIRYPESAIQENIFGKVIIQFCVNKKGEVVDIELLRKIDPLIDNETIRVISASPRWNPAKQGGNPVKQLYVLPIQFKMN